MGARFVPLHRKCPHCGEGLVTLAKRVTNGELALCPKCDALDEWPREKRWAS